MLSDNLEKIIEMVGTLARIDIEENKADANMAYAWGTASGIIMREIRDLRDNGR